MVDLAAFGCVSSPRLGHRELAYSRKSCRGMMVVVNRWEENLLVVLLIESTPLFSPSFSTLH